MQMKKEQNLENSTKQALTIPVVSERSFEIKQKLLLFVGSIFINL